MVTKKKPRMLRVTLDARCSDAGERAIVAAILQLRDVNRVESIDTKIDDDTSVDLLKLPGHPRHALESAGISTLSQLVLRSRRDLKQLKGLGKLGLRTIEARLADLGLCLRPQTQHEIMTEVANQGVRYHEVRR